MRYAVLIALLACPAAVTAAEREVFYGTWGTAKQCAREVIKPGGTVVAEPFVIGPEWLRQGQISCRLSWFPVDTREGNLFSGARAQCGEDAVRDYLLRMELSGTDLTLRWSLFQSNGPLARCPEG